MVAAQAPGALDKTRSTSDISDIKIVITNYNLELSIDITPIVHSFNIYENINDPVCTCDVIIADAIDLLARLPIIGEEILTFQYRTRGLTGEDEEAKFPTVNRSFRVHKIVDHTESSEKQLNYKINGIDDHYHINEGIDINQSFVGQNCMLAANSIFFSSFTKADVKFRPFDKFPRLYGKQNEDVKESNNTSHYIAPGLTPFEVINQLKEEAEHKEVGNPSDYVFFQSVKGIHLTTLSELKSQSPSFTYYIKDPNTEEYEDVDKGETVPDKKLTSERNRVLLIKQKTGYDHELNFKQGFYGNRVVGIDLLTKMYDERVDTYSDSYINSQTLEGPSGGQLISKGEYPKGFFGRIGSTQTRYIATELLSTSLDTGNPSSFSTVLQPSYSMAPYIYPIDKKDPDKNKDKINGTIDNKSARERQADIISKDPKIANPRRRHLFLNKKIISKATNNNIALDLMIPGNSALTVGQVINVFVPRRSDPPKAGEYDQFFCGKDSAPFLVTQVRQAYVFEASSYYTVATIIKDSYSTKIDKMYENNNAGSEE